MRIAVTGIGAITPLGNNAHSTWTAMLSGKNGIKEITLFDASDFNCKYAGQVSGLWEDLGEDFGKTGAPRIECAKIQGRGTRLAVCAADMAFQNAGLGFSNISRSRIGVCIGSAMGDLSLLENAPSQSPLGRIASGVASALGVEGPCTEISAACASGNYAIAHGAELLRSNAVDAVLVGGAEPISKILQATFTRHNHEAERVCRPFDLNRKGVVLGEGAGVLVLETLEHARKRNVPIIAELLGYGLSSDAHHMTSPHPKGLGAEAAMLQALDSAGISYDAVDYINAHGTGTPLNDRIETAAIKNVFGKKAYEIPASSTKSMTGHAMGAASAIEAVVCCMVIQNGVIPPTINYQHPDPECDLDYVANHCRRKEVNIALSNAFGIGGSNASVIFGKD